MNRNKMPMFGHQKQDYVKQDRVQALVKPSGHGGRPCHHGRADLGRCLSSVWSKLTLRAVLCGKVIMRRHCRQRHTFSILQNATNSQQLDIQVVTTQRRDFNLQKIFFHTKKGLKYNIKYNISLKNRVFTEFKFN